MNDTGTRILEWDSLQRKTPAIWGAVALIGALGLFWGYHGVTALFESRVLYAAFYVPASAGALCLVAWSLAIVLGRSRVGAPGKLSRDEDGNVSIRLPRVYRCGYVLFFLSVVVSSSVLACGLWTDDLVFPMTDGQLIVFPYVALALALYAAVSLGYFAVGWLRFPSIVCTPTSLIVQSFKVRDEIAWTDIEAIEATVSGNSMAILVEPVEDAPVTVEVNYHGPFVPPPDGPIVCVVDLFPIGPRRLLSGLRYYLDHPDARAELGDGRAIERLQQ